MLQTFCGVTSRMVQWRLLESFCCCLLRLRISALPSVGVAVTQPKFALGWGLPFLPGIPPSLDCSLYVKPLQAYTIKRQHPEWTEENTGCVYLILLSVYLKIFPIKPALHTLFMWHCGVCLHLLLHIFFSQCVIYLRHCSWCLLFICKVLLLHRQICPSSPWLVDFTACLGNVFLPQSCKILVSVFFWFFHRFLMYHSLSTWKTFLDVEMPTSQGSTAGFLSSELLLK